MIHFFSPLVIPIWYMRGLIFCSLFRQKKKRDLERLSEMLTGASQEVVLGWDPDTGSKSSALYLLEISVLYNIAL